MNNRTDIIHNLNVDDLTSEGEIATKIETDNNGQAVIGDKHTIGDIARWLCDEGMLPELISIVQIAADDKGPT